jgi:hypothetical protein
MSDDDYKAYKTPNTDPNYANDPTGALGKVVSDVVSPQTKAYDPKMYQGGATPESMQFSAGQAQQSQGANAIDPTAAGYNNGLAAQLWAQAQGKGPSLAQDQLQQGTDQNLRNSAALAASGRNPAAASYNAMQSQAGATQQMAGQSAIARLQEQYQAQQGLAGLTNQMQGAYANNAAMGQQNNQFNAGQANGQNQFNAQLGAGQNQFYNSMMAGQQGQYNGYREQKDLNRESYNYQARNGAISGGPWRGLQRCAGASWHCHDGLRSPAEEGDQARWRGGGELPRSPEGARVQVQGAGRPGSARGQPRERHGARAREGWAAGGGDGAGHPFWQNGALRQGLRGHARGDRRHSPQAQEDRERQGGGEVNDYSCEGLPQFAIGG